MTHLLYEETGPLSSAVPIILEMYSGIVRETRGTFAVLDENEGQLADPISRAAANAWVPRAEGEDVKDIAFASVREPGGLEFHRYRVLDHVPLGVDGFGFESTRFENRSPGHHGTREEHAMKIEIIPDKAFEKLGEGSSTPRWPGRHPSGA